MNSESVEFKTITIYDIDCLDPVTVHTRSIPKGTGQITITCFGKAWTAWFGSIGDNTVEEFVSNAGNDYLAGKFFSQGKQLKKDEVYLCRILDAVRETFKSQRP
jgi:hypothetical protein